MPQGKPARKRIDRAAFLYARMAYLAQLRHEGEPPEAMMRACNLGDIGQVKLLLMTWDDRSVPLPGEPKVRRLSRAGGKGRK